MDIKHLYFSTPCFTILVTKNLTYKLIPWRKVLPEKLRATQLVKTFPTCVCVNPMGQPLDAILSQINPDHVCHYQIQPCTSL